MNQTITLSDPHATFDLRPSYEVVKTIQPYLRPQIEAAVKDFIVASKTNEGVNVEGFYYQTLEAIANSTHLGGPGEFWVGVKDGQLLIYALCHISKDIDNKMTYHVSQTWVRKDYRGNPVVKEWWEDMRQRAKDLMCGHLAITSSRGSKAYERFLGHGMKHYACMLVEHF